MVTLIGFFFILLNVLILGIYVPDLVGPVRLSLITENGVLLTFSQGTVMGIL